VLGWIVRILFILAAPIAALLVSRDALNFGLVQNFCGDVSSPTPIPLALLVTKG
jgi:hypothetical protein